MNSDERIIGVLQEQGSNFEKRLDKIEAKVDTLLEFKWKLAGVVMTIGFIAGIAGRVVSQIIMSAGR